MGNKKNKSTPKKGFTLIELLIVIAIIGILSGIVTVSMSGAKEKGNKAAALTTLSSVLPELVSCQDDNGFALSTVAPTTAAYVCCKTAAASIASCDTAGTDNADGHVEKWPDLTKTGYTYQPATAGTTLALGNYEFTATKAGQPTITCNYAKNSCDTP